MTRLFSAALLVLGLAATVPASAAIVAFSGTRANVNPISAPGTGRCAPMNTVSIAPGVLSSTGSSNFGSFGSTQSHCIPGAPSPTDPIRAITDGIAQYDFAAGDTLFGTYTGTATLAAGIITGVENYIAASGTGRFAGATGSWQTVGPLAFGPNPNAPGVVGNYNGVFSGTLNLPAVPEPSSWMLLVGGFGIVGAVARRRRGAAVITT